jgi:hypothetical protein
MKTPFRSVAWVLPFMLTGCFFHRTHRSQAQPTAPPIAESTQPKPEPLPPQLPPSAATIPTQTATINPPARPLEAPPKHKLHRKRPIEKPDEKPVEEASNVAPEVSAIGQLSPGDPSDLRVQTEQSIQKTEHDLNSITRKLNEQEAKTAAQIREFLKQAKAAMASGDVDGAHTLALKAKVLLGEITH